ncbi:MAG: adenosylcobinamide-GDP ribazoletransferase [Syntrophales bacterium]|nr:adenosylcobinamide-GDP ribazoletransferase [Syntrophales bacterium]
MKAFFAALQFLTVIPLPRALTISEKDLEGSVPFFPLVGLFIGIMVAAADYLMGFILPPFALSCLTVLVLTAVTGGLHMDGLADTADGFFSARPRERMLEIMRDSRIGAMGVMAIIFIIALKIAALTPLSGFYRLGVLVLMPMAGRAAIMVMMTALPYARPGGGLAGIFIKKRSWWTPAGASVLLLVAGWMLGDWIGVGGALFAMVVAFLVTRYTFHKIGGFTGDTLGAVSEVVEAALALAATAWLHGIS